MAYGPYWWALKQILNANGANIGSMMDSGIAKEYRGETDEETIMMAEKFREDYYQQFFDGNNQFDLDPEDDEDPWILRDRTAKCRNTKAVLPISVCRKKNNGIGRKWLSFSVVTI